MKSTGIIRKLDGIGRIVIPREIRKQLKISEEDPIEILVSGNSIVLKKPEQTTCVFCKSKKNLFYFKNKHICVNCLKEINDFYLNSEK